MAFMENQLVSTDIKLLKNLNVLYVEDDPVVGSHTSSLLKHFFRNVFHCGNAEDALELLNHKTVHMIITDIELPGMSGLKLCEIIRKRDRQIPIFITSMHDHKEMLQEAVKLNLVDYLIKPVSISSITNALRESLERLSESGRFMIEISSDVRYFPLLGQIETSGNHIPLTQSEITLLNLLLNHKNQVIDRVSIEHQLSADEPMSDAAYKNLIYRLRKKIGKEHIISISGVGIKLILT